MSYTFESHIDGFATAAAHSVLAYIFSCPNPPISSCCLVSSLGLKRFSDRVVATAAPRSCDLVLTPCGTLQVLDLTDLIKANRGPLVQPLIAAAGKDISHWFTVSESNTSSAGESSGTGPGAHQSGTGRANTNQDKAIMGEPRTHIDPETGIRVPYLPMGRCVVYGQSYARSRTRNARRYDYLLGRHRGSTLNRSCEDRWGIR